MIVVYLDTPDTILLKSKDSSFHVLYHIMKQMDTDLNKWYGDRINKDFICKDLNISQINLEKILNSLIKRELLLRYQRGIYGLNPDIFTI